MKERGLYRPNERTVWTCIECGKQEEKSLSDARRRKYCSSECRDSYIARHGSPNKIKRLQLRCRWCGQRFEKLSSQALNGRGRFCSRGCLGCYTVAFHKNKISAIETRFFDLVEAAGLTLKRQVRIRRFVVDAIAKETNVAIEFDGDFWHSLPGIKEKDDRKATAIAWSGYKLIRISEKDFIADPFGTVRRVIKEVHTL